MSPANPLPIRSASWACDHGPGLRRTWASGSMFNSHCLGIIKNFIFEFVFCKWSLTGQWSMGWVVGGLEPQLTCGAAYCYLPTSLVGVLGSPLPTHWALSRPYFTLLPCYNCHPQPAAGSVSGGRPPGRGLGMNMGRFGIRCACTSQSLGPGYGSGCPRPGLSAPRGI